MTGMSLLSIGLRPTVLVSCEVRERRSLLEDDLPSGHLAIQDTSLFRTPDYLGHLRLTSDLWYAVESDHSLECHVAMDAGELNVH